MSTRLPWDGLAAFAAVMEHGSLSAAARHLGTAQPTIRRHVERLESLLRTSLFTRSPAGLTPTSDALALWPHAKNMQAAAEAASRTASGAADPIGGVVRVTSSVLMGTLVLPTMIAAILQDHPGLAIELAPDDDLHDLIRRDADIGIRLSHPTQSQLLARRLGRLELGLFAARRYLQDRVNPTELSDLSSHRLIGQDRKTDILAGFAQLGLNLSQEAFSFRTDNDAAQVSAVRAGAGIGVMQVALARSLDDVVRVLPDVRFYLDLWIAMHEDQRPSRRIRIVFDRLASDLKPLTAA